MNIIRLKNVIVPVGGSFQLEIADWVLQKNESWFICGDNASGKSTFAKLLLNQVCYQGDCQFNLKSCIEDAISYVSPDIDNEIFNEEIRNDDSEFMAGGFDPGRSAKEIIISRNETIKIDENRLTQFVDMFQIQHIIHKGYRFLSSGETRKVLIVSALIRNPDLLILDDPFSGLDFNSKTGLGRSIENLIASGIQVVLIAPIRTKVPKGIDKLLFLKEGKILLSGNKRDILTSNTWEKLIKRKINLPEKLPDKLMETNLTEADTIIHMKNISVYYGNQPVFENLTWTLKKGEHWSIIGPNGSGKTTLLSMISGDNPKAYGKELWIFGVKRGSGESIWDIKKHIGFISSDFHRSYRVNCSLMDVIVSGFFDSIGVYDPVTTLHEKIANEWLQLIGMAGDGNQSFKNISYGRQRMILLARAMVKHPQILILDEPCEGLDDHNRALILGLIDYIAENSNTQILHVTHDKSEKLKCITHQLMFTQKNNLAYRGVCKKFHQ